MIDQARAFSLSSEFSIPPRRFRYDFHIDNTPVLIEIQGGVFASRRYGHSTGAGIQRDCEKLRYAHYNNYILFTFTSKDITNEKITELLDWLEFTYPATES